MASGIHLKIHIRALGYWKFVVGKIQCLDLMICVRCFTSPTMDGTICDAVPEVY